MPGVVVSHADVASERIGEHLLALREWDERTDPGRPDGDGGGTYYCHGAFEVRSFEELHLSLEGVADAFDAPGPVVFASRHSGETGPLLTAHFTGNFGPAEYGGADRELSTAAPAALDCVVSAFEEYAPEGYRTGIECTHHGPSDVGAPSLFVELGSGPAQWADDEAAEAVARAILALDDTPDPTRTLVGFGGGHYAPRFARLLAETDWTVGHVAADWCLEALGDPDEHRDVLGQAFERSGADHALVVGDHPGVEAAVEALGYRAVGETWVRQADGVPLDLVERLEDALCPVEAGLRLGDPAAGHEGAFEVVELPDELLAEARGIDRDRTRRVVEASLLAFETDDNGATAAGRGAVRSPADREALVEDLADVLADAYESVERHEEALVARKQVFDPGRARELGVPEGPAFGRLAEGQSVTVDGRTVDPGEVTESETYRFPLR